MSELLELDAAAFSFVNRSLACASLDYLFWAMTLLGNGAVQGAFILWLWVMGRPRGAVRTGSLCFWALMLSTAIAQGLKHAFHRPRPLLVLDDVRLLVDPLMGNSFPSGHAATSFALATIVSATCPKWRWPAWIIALLVGISRVYVGVHFPSDILASAVIGVLSGIVVLRIADRVRGAHAGGRRGTLGSRKVFSHRY